MTPSEIVQMFSSISSRYDLANHILSCNRDRSWRRSLARWANPHPAEKVLDVCTGTANLLLEFAWHTPKLNLWGLDLSRQMLALGKDKLQRFRHTKALLIEGDALKLPFQSECFGIVTIAFGLRNLQDLRAGLVEMARVLRPGGWLLILEFALPPNTLLRKPYLFYLKNLIPRLGALLTGSREAYEYLQNSICEFPAPDEILELLRLLGFRKLEAKALTGGIAYAYRGERL